MRPIRLLHVVLKYGSRVQNPNMPGMTDQHQATQLGEKLGHRLTMLSGGVIVCQGKASVQLLPFNECAGAWADPESVRLALEAEELAYSNGYLPVPETTAVFSLDTPPPSAVPVAAPAPAAVTVQAPQEAAPSTAPAAAVGGDAITAKLLAMEDEDRAAALSLMGITPAQWEAMVAPLSEPAPEELTEEQKAFARARKDAEEKAERQRLALARDAARAGATVIPGIP